MHPSAVNLASEMWRAKHFLLSKILHVVSAAAQGAYREAGWPDPPRQHVQQSLGLQSSEAADPKAQQPLCPLLAKWTAAPASIVISSSGPRNPQAINNAWIGVPLSAEARSKPRSNPRLKPSKTASPDRGGYYCPKEPNCLFFGSATSLPSPAKEAPGAERPGSKRTTERRRTGRGNAPLRDSSGPT